MDSRENGYVGIRESGEEIPKNSVMFGYNKTQDENAQDFVAIGFDTLNSKNSVAIGHDAKAETEYSIAIGDGSLVKKKENCANLFFGGSCNGYSVAIGANTSVRDMHSSAVGYKSVATVRNSTAIGCKSEVTANNSTAIGYGAKADKSNTIVLGNEDTTVYIAGNLVVNHSALIGLAAKANDNLCFRPYAEEDGRHFAVFNAGDWKGTDSNIALVQDATNTNNLVVKVGPYETETESWNGDYGYNNRAHINFTDSSRGDQTSTHAHSDIRLKNIGKKFVNGLDSIKKLNFYHFTWKNDKNKTPQVGVIAQDLQKIFPDSVLKGDDVYLKIRWDEMFFAAINAIKELSEQTSDCVADILSLKMLIQKQQAEIAAQSKIIAQQQVELAKLSARIEKLEK